MYGLWIHQYLRGWMDSHRGKRMKIRLEIIDDDDMENTSIEFGGPHWKKCILAFIDSIADDSQLHAESSSNSLSISSFSQAQQPVPSLSAQQQMLPQPAMQQFMQQPVSQQPIQQFVSPQYPPIYQQAMPQMQASQPPYYAAPVGTYNYYGQPIQQAPAPQFIPQSVASVPPMQQVVNANPVVPQAMAAPVARKTPRLQERLNDSSLTISERLELFLKYEYPRVWFSSHDVQQHYERIYGPIKQSTVSTYLSRMFRKNTLERRGNRTQREYRYIDAELEMPVISSAMAIPEFQRI
jgi:hypothetical protein